MGQATSQRDGERIYLCIDLKTFYASVECVERGLDTLKDNLVVADTTRGRGTICLAITAAMKRLGIRNRCRIFEIPSNVRYTVARPRMRHYMEVSAQIYGTYLEYVSPEDIHVYSIDECFIDATPYLSLYRCDARAFALELMGAVKKRFGILATAGIGTNLFLAKIALDIMAKHANDGIGYLDEERFRQHIWEHRPITDIWGIGPGIARRLESLGAFDLKGITQIPEEALYKEFGVNAEYLIDHAWGQEPCTMADIHTYRPSSSSLSTGQILSRPYSFEEGRTILREMVESLSFDLLEKRAVCDRISLYIGYAKATGKRKPNNSPVFIGEHGAQNIERDRSLYATGSRKLPEQTDSFSLLLVHFDALYQSVADQSRSVKKINIGVGNLVPVELRACTLFSGCKSEAEEHSLQDAILDVKHRYGKNALMRGVSYREEATGRERNNQVGGHRA